MPEITEPGDDGNYGSAAMYDVMILQVCVPHSAAVPGPWFGMLCADESSTHLMGEPDVSQPPATSNLSASHVIHPPYQALSKRIHYGKFVAESKFLSQTEKYTRLIRAHDSEGLMAAITDAVVEAKVSECTVWGGLEPLTPRLDAGRAPQSVGDQAPSPGSVPTVSAQARHAPLCRSSNEWRGRLPSLDRMWGLQAT